MLGLKYCIAVWLLIAGIAKHLPECHAKDFSYVRRGWYYYNLKCPTGAVGGCVLFDFGQVEKHDSYWSLCTATLFAQVNEVHK